MPETTDTIVISDSEPEQLRERITRNRSSKIYMREYYQKHKDIVAREHSERIYTCESSLLKHQGRSVKYYLSRVEAIFDEINNTLADEFDPEKTLAMMEPRLKIK